MTIVIQGKGARRSQCETFKVTLRISTKLWLRKVNCRLPSLSQWSLRIKSYNLSAYSRWHKSHLSRMESNPRPSLKLLKSYYPALAKIWFWKYGPKTSTHLKMSFSMRSRVWKILPKVCSHCSQRSLEKMSWFESLIKLCLKRAWALLWYSKLVMPIRMDQSRSANLLRLLKKWTSI